MCLAPLNKSIDTVFVQSNGGGAPRSRLPRRIPLNVDGLGGVLDSGRLVISRPR